MKYLLILIIFIPFSLYGILRAVVLYKIKKISMSKMTLKIFFWMSLMITSIFAKYIISEAIVLSITDGDFMTIYDIVLSFGLLISLMLNAKLINVLNDNSKKINKLLSLYSIDSSSKK